MKKFGLLLTCIACLSLVSGAALAKESVSVFWAEYDGVTPEFAQKLETEFEKANPDIDLQIVSIPWDWRRSSAGIVRHRHALAAGVHGYGRG